MQDRLLFIISPPRAGSTLLQHMLGSHSQIFTYPEPHLITPLAFLGFHDLVDKAPYDHVNAAEAMKTFVAGLPRGEDDYLDALRAYSDTLYGRMLLPTGKRYFLDKTPAYALVMPFLTRLYPRARYVVLTRHPLAVASSYAESFFHGDWTAANLFNPVVNRYVPAIARVLREPPQHLLHVGYEQLVREPEAQLAEIFRFLALPDEPQVVSYAGRYTPVRGGRGDPIGVGVHTRPTDASVDRFRDELVLDPRKRAVAAQIVAALDPDDVARWGYDHAELSDATRAAQPANVNMPAARKAGHDAARGYLLQRRIMLALKKNIRERPHGRVVERVRYYCNVLLRE
ncbi:MAG: sulfotransferase [Polyangiales bacterium]